MSRPYRIVVQRTVEQEVSAEDRSVLRLNLDEQVTEEQLAAALARQGWVEAEPGVWTKERAEGETMSCELAAREVVTVVSGVRTLAERRERELRGDTWNWKQMREMTAEELEALRAAEEEKLGEPLSESRVRGAERELAAQVSAQLQAGADERRREVGRVVVEALAESLRARAASLGTVTSTSEGQWQGDDFELTLTISE